MGYRREARIYKLNFADPEFHGLEVRAKSCPTGVFLEMSTLHEIQIPIKPADEAKVYRLFDHFSKALVSWNLEDDAGSPVPADLHGIYTQDLEFILAIMLAWMDAVGGVSTPFPNPPDFDTGSIPMETLAN